MLVRFLFYIVISIFILVFFFFVLQRQNTIMTLFGSLSNALIDTYPNIGLRADLFPSGTPTNTDFIKKIIDTILLTFLS
jgi:hypothetical protein